MGRMGDIYMDQCNAARPSEEDVRVMILRRALRDLLEEVEALEGYELSSDLEPHKAEAIWDAVLFEAGKALRETE